MMLLLAGTQFFNHDAAAGEGDALLGVGVDHDGFDHWGGDGRV